jgi:solute carrier family 25 protein 33/36
MVDTDTFIHLVAGGVGGTTGAILTCPLEVVKTRLQSSNSGFDNKIPKIESNSVKIPTGKSSSNKYWSSGDKVAHRHGFGSQFTINLLNRSNKGSSAHHVLYSTLPQPRRPVKISVNNLAERSSKLITGSSWCRQVHTASAPNPPKSTLGVWDCLKHIWTNEGPRGLFRGLGPNLVGVAPSRAIYFWSYSTSKQAVNSRLPKQNRDTPFVHVISAASAGFVSSCATNPIWLVKTRLQLNRSEGGFFSVIKNIHSEQGIAGFWKGVTASWWGISETMIHFVIYEFLKKTLDERRSKRKDQEKSFKDFVGFMICGATSKTCATCVAYPHEVARTRMRESGMKYKSFWQTLLLVRAEEGRAGLYRGLGTQLIRQIPNTAIMMATYELTVIFLTNYVRERRSKELHLQQISNKTDCRQ